MEIRGNQFEISIEKPLTALVPIETDYDKNKSIEKIEKVLKRTIDIIGSLVGILLLIPITICIYIANLLAGDGGPIFYKQKRIGKDGKIFNMYKYRSMVVNADEKLEKYLEENEEAAKEYKKYKKLKNDPRVTKIGNFIRKTSIDEIPQFINILKGEMSLVGPRRYLPREKEEMDGYFKYITSLTPGLTGFWQINGRSDVTFYDRLDMDMKYYFIHDLKLDIKLLYQTVKTITKKEGAM